MIAADYSKIYIKSKEQVVPFQFPDNKVKKFQMSTGILDHVHFHIRYVTFSSGSLSSPSQQPLMYT